MVLKNARHLSGLFKSLQVEVTFTVSTHGRQKSRNVSRHLKHIESKKQKSAFHRGPASLLAFRGRDFPLEGCGSGRGRATNTDWAWEEEGAKTNQVRQLDSILCNPRYWKVCVNFRPMKVHNDPKALLNSSDSFKLMYLRTFGACFGLTFRKVGNQRLTFPIA